MKTHKCKESNAIFLILLIMIHGMSQIAWLFSTVLLRIFRVEYLMIIDLLQFSMSVVCLHAMLHITLLLQHLKDRWKVLHV